MHLSIMNLVLEDKTLIHAAVNTMGSSCVKASVTIEDVKVEDGGTTTIENTVHNRNDARVEDLVKVKVSVPSSRVFDAI